MLDFDEIHMLNWSSSLSINMCCLSKSVLSYGAVIFTARKAKLLLKWDLIEYSNYSLLLACFRLFSLIVSFPTESYWFPLRSMVS